MPVGSLLLAAALLVVVALVVARPFLLEQNQQPQEYGDWQALQARKEALLEQIRTLDFDHETGKVPDEEHRQLRARWVAEAAILLQRLDELSPEAAQGATDGAAARAEQEIEAAIARFRRAADGTGGEDGTADAVEAAVAQLRRREDSTQETTGGLCTQCGRPHEDGDKFCAHCGHPLA